MKKVFVSILCAILLLALLAGCGATGKDLMYAPGGAEVKNNSLAYSNSLYDAEERADEIDLPVDRKIIKNAKVECSAGDVSEKYQTILLWLRENGGYEFSQDKTVRDDYCTIHAVLKIAPEKLGELLDVIGNNTEIINSSTSSNDISEAYTDMQLRLKSKKAALEQYYKMLEKADSVGEILNIQKVINEYTADIESMEGKLIFWDKQVSESTINISMYQSNDPSKPKPVSFKAMPFSNMFEQIGSGFMSVINVLVALFQWLCIVLLSASPVIVIAVIVFYIVKAVRKRRK